MNTYVSRACENIFAIGGERYFDGKALKNFIMACL